MEGCCRLEERESVGGVLLAGEEGVLEGCCLLGEMERWRGAACWGRWSVEGCCRLGERECWRSAAG